jgi:hypothetical protein
MDFVSPLVSRLSVVTAYVAFAFRRRDCARRVLDSRPAMDLNARWPVSPGVFVGFYECRSLGSAATSPGRRRGA